MRISLLAQKPQLVCQASRKALVLAMEGRFEGSGAPESQTLIVPSFDPDTILVPSGENATEQTMSLCASVSVLNSSKLSVRQSNKRQFWPRRGDLRTAAHPNPRV